MNFCHPCQRHLNGALACPGCGTPATYAQTPPTAYEAYAYTLPQAPNQPTAADVAGGVAAADEYAYGEPEPEPTDRPAEAAEGFPYGEPEPTDEPAEAVEGVAAAEDAVAPGGRRARG
ncbi:hypothetical protein ABZ299_23880, partial [Streptomyces sp. NPDC006184]